jgi:hypothetical protein
MPAVFPSRRTLVLSAAAALALAGYAPAATVTWSGATSNDFQVGTNWSSGLAPNGVDTQAFGAATPGTITNVTFTGASTAGKIQFTGSGSYTLTGGTITLFDGTVDGIAILSTSTAAQTIASNIVLGVDGTTASTTSLTNNTGNAGPLLLITGNISGGGTGAGTAVKTLSFGSVSGNNGNYEVQGNITAGGAASVAINKRGNGTLTLSGVNTVSALASNEAASTIRVTGGTTTIANAAAAGWGGANQTTSVVRVSGGTLNSFDSRNVRNSITVDGGTLNLGQGNTTGGARLSFNNNTNAGSYAFNLSAGTVTFLPTYATNNFGIRLGNDGGAASATASANVTGTQTGGTFVVNGAGGQDSTFSLGTALSGAAAVNSYTLSGGVLDIRGSTGLNGWLTLGAAADGTNTTTFTLSGTGKLIVRSAASGATTGINGRQAGAAQILDLSGGTLVAGRIDAANLRGSAGGTNGTIVNNGTTISPGDSTNSGRTFISGDLNVLAGALAAGIGGTTASTAWQDAALAGRYDVLAVSGTATLGGSLSVSLIDGFAPSAADTFTIVTGTSVGGAFGNVAFGSRINTAGGEGSFLVSLTGGNSVVLSNFQPIPEPTSLAGLLLAGGALITRRRRA